MNAVQQPRPAVDLSLVTVADLRHPTRATAAMILLTVGGLLALLAWVGEALISRDVRAFVFPVAVLGSYALGVVGGWRLLREHTHAPDVPYLRSGGTAARIGWTGRFVLIVAAVSAINTLGFFGGSLLALSGDEFLSGIASLVMALLHLSVTVVASVTGALLLLLATASSRRARPAPVRASPADNSSGAVVPSAPVALDPGGASA